MRGGLEPERALEEALEEAIAAGKSQLPEHVGFGIASTLGLRVPLALEIKNAAEAATLDLSCVPGDELVVKLLSSEVAHKSDLGGVAFCTKQPAALERAIESIRDRVGQRARVEGYSVQEKVDHRRLPGDEILVGVRWTDDFGPVAVLGLGGVEVERLTGEGAFAPALAGSSASVGDGRFLSAEHPMVRFLAEPYRGAAGHFELDALGRLIARLLAFADVWMSPQRAHRLSEIEFNPVVMSAGEPTALDVLARPARGPIDIAPARPIEKLAKLFRPSSIAIAGVSHRQNVGRVILGNILRQGFDRERLWVVKKGAEEVDNCRCFPGFAQLPEPADLAVLAVAAADLPDLVEEIVATGRAENLILIPGGVGERSGSEAVARRLERTIRGARTPRQEGGQGDGPIVTGGNCLGVRSLPGRVDTLFIPGHKLRFADVEPSPLAILSQSGAFAIARASRLSALNPRYLVTFGNQIDLTLGDYLTYLADDPAVSVFACYVEGFQPLDGRRFLDAVRAIHASGRTVILYRAGRTAAGARAAASHTASVAGSYRVTRELTERAGGLVADSIEAFEDLIQTFCGLDGKRPGAGRLGAISNAGFEAVAIADNLNGLALATLTNATRAKLSRVFEGGRIDAIVSPGNPLDVTPMLDDAAFASAAEAILQDPHVDLGIIGCVPLTGALQTLPTGDGHSENLEDPEAIGRRLVGLRQSATKPWVAVIDSGPLYDPLSQSLSRAGIPTFRAVDRALAALASWAKLRRRQGDVNAVV